MKSESDRDHYTFEERLDVLLREARAYVGLIEPTEKHPHTVEIRWNIGDPELDSEEPAAFWFRFPEASNELEAALLEFAQGVAQAAYRRGFKEARHGVATSWKMRPDPRAPFGAVILKDSACDFKPVLDPVADE